MLISTKFLNSSLCKCKRLSALRCAVHWYMSIILSFSRSISLTHIVIRFTKSCSSSYEWSIKSLKTSKPKCSNFFIDPGAFIDRNNCFAYIGFHVFSVKKSRVIELSVITFSAVWLYADCLRCGH